LVEDAQELIFQIAFAGRPSVRERVKVGVEAYPFRPVLLACKLVMRKP
jgi:hypothetical protein